MTKIFKKKKKKKKKAILTSVSIAVSNQLDLYRGNTLSSVGRNPVGQIHNPLKRKY